MATQTISDLQACCWSTISADAATIAAVQREAVARHPGAAIVESCQRTEAYGFASCECSAPVHLSGASALRHLAEVAAGLHSVVLGEAEILGQVRAGFADARGPLRHWADLAIAAARELRSETSFNSHAGALLDRALKVAGEPHRGRLLVLGAGQMGRLVAERGRHLGFEEVIVATRTPLEDAAWGNVPLSDLASAGEVDVIAGCLGSGAQEIQAPRMPSARLLVDLGTPRNFASGQAVPVLTLADLMGDEERRPHAVRRRRRLREALATKVELRVAEAALDGRSPVGVIRAGAERVRRQELERMRRLHPEMDQEALDTFAKSLVNQLLHAPSERLRASDEDFGRAVAALFAQD